MSGWVKSMVMKRKKQALYKQQNGCCFYCGNKFAFSVVTIDHVVRKKDGGTNAMSNLVLACFPCNQYREMGNASEKVKKKFAQRQAEYLLTGGFNFERIARMQRGRQP